MVADLVRTPTAGRWALTAEVAGRYGVLQRVEVAVITQGLQHVHRRGDVRTENAGAEAHATDAKLAEARDGWRSRRGEDVDRRVDLVYDTGDRRLVGDADHEDTIGA